MEQKIMTFKEALAAGAKRFFTGVPCVNGHVDFRLVSSKQCLACDRSRKRSKYNNDPVFKSIDNARSRERYEKNMAENGQFFRAREAERYRTRYNTDADFRASELLRASVKEKAIKTATPPWVNRNDLIKIYKECPEGYHVDHIVPINAPFIEGTKVRVVCGLNVPWNLQILKDTENWSKNNRFDGTNDNQSWLTKLRKCETIAS